MAKDPFVRDHTGILIHHEVKQPSFRQPTQRQPIDTCSPLYKTCQSLIKLVGDTFNWIIYVGSAAVETDKKADEVIDIKQRVRCWPLPNTPHPF